MGNISTTPRHTEPGNVLIIDTPPFLVIDITMAGFYNIYPFFRPSFFSVPGQSKPAHVASSTQVHIIIQTRTSLFTHLDNLEFQCSLPLIHISGLWNNDENANDGVNTYKRVLCYQDKVLHEELKSPAKTCSQPLPKHTSFFSM